MDGGKAEMGFSSPSEAFRGALLKFRTFSDEDPGCDSFFRFCGTADRGVFLLVFGLEARGSVRAQPSLLVF